MSDSEGMSSEAARQAAFISKLKMQCKCGEQITLDEGEQYSCKCGRSHLWIGNRLWTSYATPAENITAWIGMAE